MDRPWSALEREWRSGTARGQGLVLGLLMGAVTACFVVTIVSYSVMPVSTYFVWLVIGMLLLRFRPLVWLTAYTVPFGLLLAVVDVWRGGEFGSARASGMVALVLASVLILFQASRQRSGLPAPIGAAMLADLRDRLQRQGTVPPLPDGWHCQTAMVAAHDVGYAGDFMVAHLEQRGERLEMILVDVVGKGVGAATDALQFAGAVGGLIGSLPPVALMSAANDFLLRQDADETFATAVHVVVDLRTGGYQVHSAGHPPALRWGGGPRTWEVDNARGMALGVAPRPELHHSSGTLRPGDALMFYTDGVVESRGTDIDDGIDWLRATGSRAVQAGFAGAARRIVDQVPRGDDDRAVLVLWRS
ncbi:MAG: protein phosphatase [Nocardioides sp.]|nr:protein phosphatase [Nocardioides sp.]